MLLVIALQAAQAQAKGGTDVPAGQKVPVKPLSNPGTWLTANDFWSLMQRYPSAAIAYDMTVGPDGRLSGCKITTSSGSPEIDRLACNLLTRRARFTPARDASGKAVASAFPGRFSWHSGNAKPTRNGFDGSAGSEAPPAPGVLEVAVAALPATYRRPVKAQVRFGPNHRVRECTIEESSGNASVDMAACTQLRTLVVSSKGSSADAAEYVVTFQAEPAAKP